jgi:hypothetical protein
MVMGARVWGGSLAGAVDGGGAGLGVEAEKVPTLDLVIGDVRLNDTAMRTNVEWKCI